MGETEQTGLPAEEIEVELGSLQPDLERIGKLRDLLPEAFIDNVFDPQRAVQALGLDLDSIENRYGLNWAGRDEAIEALRRRSVATLRPNIDRSSDFDDARHLLIEGDNLEVLRLMQRPYGGKVKMIYIDPPYNTGGDFIYKDDFRDGLQAYLRFTGQLDENGDLNGSNGETAGRYHSNWLTMMYPRLALARNLLRRDGVIFVSIDDHEVHNLRLLMDEVFGPENFVATVIWQKVYSPKSTARHFSEDHDYVLVYARDASTWIPGLLPRTSKQESAYKNPDNDPRGPWKPGDLSARNYYSKGTYEIVTPAGRVISGPPAGNYWRYSRERLKELDSDNRIWWGKDGNAVPAIKRFLSEVLEGRVPQTIWTYEEVGHNDEAKKELLKRVTFASSDSVFDTPKPTRLVRRMLQLATKPDEGDIVLDFFAGSGTTGDAVLQANAEDGGNRRFILVQAPEPTGYEDYETVADITRARISAAREEVAGKIANGGTGVRDLSLGRSNFKVWEMIEDEDPEHLEQRILDAAVSLADDNTDDGIVVEMMLAEGIDLTARIERHELHGSTVLLLDPEGRRVALCLDRELNPDFEDLAQAIIGLAPKKAIFLDIAFTNRSAVLTDTYYRMKRNEIEFRAV